MNIIGLAARTFKPKPRQRFGRPNTLPLYHLADKPPHPPAPTSCVGPRMARRRNRPRGVPNLVRREPADGASENREAQCV